MAAETLGRWQESDEEVCEEVYDVVQVRLSCHHIELPLAFQDVLSLIELGFFFLHRQFVFFLMLHTQTHELASIFTLLAFCIGVLFELFALVEELDVVLDLMSGEDLHLFHFVRETALGLLLLHHRLV